MKTIEQAARQCVKDLCIGTTATEYFLTEENAEAIIAAAFREVCEPLEREAKAQGEHAVAMTEHAQSLQAALAEAKAEVAGLRTALEIRNQVWDDEFGWIHKNAIVTLAALRAEVADLKAAGGPPFIRSEAIRNLRDQVCGLKVGNDQLRARVADLSERLSKYENTN